MVKLSVIVMMVAMAVGSAVLAQKAADPPVPQPTAEQKARLIDLARTWDTKQREAESARDKYTIQLMATLAELGLKPSETVVTWKDGEPVFSKVPAKESKP